MRPHLTPEGLLDPEMPAEELRLRMGELTAAEVSVARTAIRAVNRMAASDAPRGTAPLPSPSGGQASSRDLVARAATRWAERILARSR